MRSKALLSMALATSVVALTALSGCKSNEKTTAVSSDEVICICGTPEEMMHGCTAPCCIEGYTDPDNDMCVCGPMDLSEED